MNRKQYMCKLTHRKHIRMKPYRKPPSRDHSTVGEAVLKLYLNDDEHIEFDVDEEYLNIVRKRTMYMELVPILDMLYRKYPEMFDSHGEENPD